MKLISNLKTLALISLTALSVYLMEFKEYKVPDGKLLVDKITIDSLNNIKPDTIKVDTIVYKTKWYSLPKDTVWLPAEEVNDTIKHYIDSLENDDLKLSFKADLNTKTFDLYPTFDYSLKVPKTIEKTIIKPKVIYVPQKPVIKAKNKLYGHIGLGGNKSGFVGSIGSTLITKNNNYYGIDVSRLNGQSYTQFKIGAQIW